MTPIHLVDVAHRMMADLDADMELLKQHGGDLKDLGVDWALGDLSRQQYIIKESLKEFANACERVYYIRDVNPKTK